MVPVRYTQQNLQQSDEGAGPACDRVGSRLSRYLDNDLSAEAATDVAAHLTGCDTCRREHDDLVAVRTALRALPTPNSDVVRDRVFTRLERAARVVAAERAEAERERRTRFGFAWLRRGPGLGIGGAFATLAIAGVVTSAFFLHPGSDSKAVNETSGVRAGTPVALPAPGRMETLFQLHDARAEAVAQVTVESAAPGNASSDAGIEGERSGDTDGASPVKPATASSDSDSSSSGSTSDEVPEAL